jgi:SNF2 family DNA or RNA helicase
VEEKIMSLQQSKLQLFDSVVSEGSKLLSTLNKEEIKALFSY